MRKRPSLRDDPPDPVDVTTSPHLQGVFAPVVDEVDVENLVVDGTIPAELDGDYIRNGPNPRFTPLGRYIYPLDGDGMLHRIRLRDGKARYTNRFVRTPWLSAEEDAGKPLWTGFASQGWSPGPQVVGFELAYTLKDLPSINIVRHGGRLLALAESNNPFSCRSDDLTAWTRETFDDAIPYGITAHPKIDPATGEMVVFCYSRTEPFLTWSVIDRDGIAVRAAVPVSGVERPVMIHDMALTAHYLVVVLGPLFISDPSHPLSWEPEQGTRIALIPRDGSPVRWLGTEAFWVWHTANAHETTAPNGQLQVVLDYVRWSAPVGLAPQTPGLNGALARLTMDPRTGTAHHEILTDRHMEFPRIDDRLITRPHPTVAASLRTGRQQLLAGDSDALGWYSTTEATFTTWDAPQLSLGEQTFLPRPGDLNPDHGWWTTIATDRTTMTSRLLIIPATDPGSGPIAAIHLPQRVPLGLHGSWLPTAE